MSFRFLWEPWALLLFTLPLIALCVWGFIRSRRDGDGLGLAWARRIVLVLAVAGIGATPTVITETEEVISNLEVYIVVDRTGSMAAEDYNATQTRLTGVANDVQALMDAFPGSRYSVLSFAVQAQRELPLTSDSRAVRAWADTLRQENTWYAGGSAIDRPAALLERTLANAQELNPQNVRIVFFLSDGENTVGDTTTGDESPSAYASLRGYVDGGAVLGYGTAAGATMKEWTGIDDPNRPRIQDPETGEDAISRFDETTLRELAAVLGVRYAHRTEPGDLEFLADTVNLESIVDDGRAVVTVHRDVYWPFVWVIVGILAWEAFDAARAIREMRGQRVR
ncbi:MAG: VWA domain-containing protein [Ruaniaceae bacterium]|nr:VWA domain-containing protein [Ruaniaceae bacterium]